MPASQSTDVQFFFDPACPWTWITSRWLVAAADQRGLRIQWRPYSLLVKGGDEIPDEFRAAVEDSHRALRVIAALGEQGDDAVAAFYAERGHRTFRDGDGGDGDGGEGDGGDGDAHGAAEAPDLAEVLRAAGLDPALAAAADDASHDATINASMDEAHRLAGSGAGSPITSLTGTGVGFFGPVLTAVPDGEAAGTLWDHYVGLQAIPQFHELKRDRETGPTFPPRP